MAFGTYPRFSEEMVSTPTTFCERGILFTGNANPDLAKAVANHLGVPLGAAAVKCFSDGEIQIRVNENVRNKDVFILQSVCSCETQSVNDSLMELFLLVRTMKRASSASITAVIPYYGYARQDRKTLPRVPISAADIALMLEVAGVDRVVTVDLHCGQIQGFFQNAPVDNLYAAPLLAAHFAQKELQNVVVLSPDAGGVERAKKFLEILTDYGITAGISMISKQRGGPGTIESMTLIGDVTGADVIIVDDLCDTAGTLVKAAQLVKDEGANRIFAAITHPVFSGSAYEKISNSVIEEIVITDTIPLRINAPSNIRTVSVGSLLGEAIRRIHYGESVSELFP